ncbi:hypothetical protein [Motilibacter deserti]|uniref:Uncharacterized protein n=1 Tax=Motilibacter deserti TaxID=2714956 RepID=A0ABX0GZU6_9ACTN|nr:hypothetical protein [Motilibacter deserti]NHC16342.1 hypothetical protein [Motilibacter deserti]
MEGDAVPTVDAVEAILAEIRAALQGGAILVARRAASVDLLIERGCSALVEGASSYDAMIETLARGIGSEPAQALDRRIRFIVTMNRRDARLQVADSGMRSYR